MRDATQALDQALDAWIAERGLSGAALDAFLIRAETLAEGRLTPSMFMQTRVSNFVGQPPDLTGWRSTSGT